MKTLSKLAAIAAFIGTALLGTQAMAQTAPADPWHLGIGIEGGIPTGDISSYSHFELGGNARLQYDLSPVFSLMLTSGYDNIFSRQTVTINGTLFSDERVNLGIIPVKAGAKVFFAKNLYADGEAGAGFETTGPKQTKLILSPGIGWSDTHWDVGLRYENYSGESNNFGAVMLRLAYGFKL